MKIVMLVMFFMLLVPVIILGTKVGKQMDKWLDNHFPNVEE